jgi:hypothetical protein
VSRHWAFKAAVLILIGGWILFSPAYRQVYKGRSTWFPRWVMFHGFGRNVCDVRFFTSTDEGKTLDLVDRFEVLQRDRNWSTNKSLVRMDEPDAVRKVARRLCFKLGEDADVRSIARCGSRDYWRKKFSAKKNLCDVSEFPGRSKLHRRKP